MSNDWKLQEIKKYILGKISQVKTENQLDDLISSIANANKARKFDEMYQKINELHMEKVVKGKN